MAAGRVAFNAAVRHTCAQHMAFRVHSTWHLVCTAQPSAAANRDPLPPDAALKILVIDENPVRRPILEAGLREAGFVNVVLVKNTIGLLDQVYRIDPDVILIDLENPSRDVLEQMFQVSRAVRRPRAKEGARQTHPRSVHLPLQRGGAPAGRARPRQERA
jgi:PleD family two-component response regulator